MKTIVLGPPGTGKTETLLNEVDKYLKTTDITRIAFLKHRRILFLVHPKAFPKNKNIFKYRHRITSLFRCTLIVDFKDP